MNDQQHSSGTLDSEFDHYLVEMKQFVLKLPPKTGVCNKQFLTS